MRLLLLSILVGALCAGLAAAGSPSRLQSGRCLDGGDRKTKLTLIEKLRRNPQILILGSSRGRTAEPSLLRRLTGRRAFNAAVKSGTAADAWVMVRFAADHFPPENRGYIWFIGNTIATKSVPSDLAADPRARRYLDGNTHARTSSCRLSSLYRADGSIADVASGSPQDHARRLAKAVARLVAHVNSHPPRPLTIDRAQVVYFERAIGFMNDHGSRPVIVLNPVHPRVLAALERHGFPARKAARAYLKELHSRSDFVVVDCQDIRVWHGSAAHFVDATHVDQVNMRRMLKYVAAHSRGAL
ncbi:MAG: hypothetical protein M3R70_01360 [Actinomycetota bacterium]|nr:hypothetical protein [Actinomycetota bacterium]